MTPIATYNEPAFKARLTYFQTPTFASRMAKLQRRLKRGDQLSDAAFWRTLGCSETEWAAWLTIVDTMEALAGREPRNGFPVFTKHNRAGAVDVKTSPNGDLLDFEFIEWAPTAAPANLKGPMQ